MYCVFSTNKDDDDDDVTVYATQLYRTVGLGPAMKQNLLDMSRIAVISKCFKSHMLGQCIIS